MNVTYRPIGADWPGKRRGWAERKRYTFKGSWSSTLTLLERELRMLDARNVVFQIDLREADIRADGLPRANARVNDSAVILSFQSKYGPLRYYCDYAADWQHNVRAIALGLEHLRAVDRYGITRRGEQYAGWKALPPASGETVGIEPRFANNLDAANWILTKALGEVPNTFQIKLVLADKEARTGVYRAAAKKCHPDTGGSREDWDMLTAAKEILDKPAEVAA